MTNHCSCSVCVQLGLRTIPAGFGGIFSTAPSALAAAAGVTAPAPTAIPQQRSAEECEEVVRQQAREYAAELRERAASELKHLTFLRYVFGTDAGTGQPGSRLLRCRVVCEGWASVVH